MSAPYGSMKHYVSYLGYRFSHFYSLHAIRPEPVIDILRTAGNYSVRQYRKTAGFIYPYYLKFKNDFKEIINPVLVRYYVILDRVRFRMNAAWLLLSQKTWFKRICQTFVTIRARAKEIIAVSFQFVKVQLKRIPEPEWFIKSRKIYNENEKIIKFRTISTRKIITSEKVNTRALIWSVVFVLVAYSGFHKVLEFTYKSDIENELSHFFEREINIKSLSFDFFPGIRLLASNVLSRNDSGEIDARIHGIYLGVDFKELLQGDLDINYLHIDDATVDQKFLLSLPSTFSKPADNEEEDSSININTFTAAPVKVLTDRQNDLGDYRVTVVMNQDKNLKIVKITPAQSNNMTLTITPDGDVFAFNLTASNWTIPGVYPIELQSTEITGTLYDDKLVTKNISGELYGGRFNGDLSLMWPDQVSLITSLELTDVDSGMLLQSTGKKIITGKMDYKGVLKVSDLVSHNLWLNTWIKADFRFKNGVIYKADLEKASSLMEKKETREDKTRFENFRGRIFADRGNITLDKLEISSSALAAAGKLKVNKNNNLDGELDVGLNNTKGILTVPIKISGTVDTPSLRPTNEAMAGAAVGTAVLGPGIGTALGVKAGKAVSWFKSLINKEKQ